MDATATMDNSSQSKEYRIAELNHQKYKRARDNGHTDFAKKFQKNSDYYAGDQWEKEVLKQLAAEGRPALTINKILSTVNVLLGEQLSRRASFQAKVRRDTNDELAQIVTKTLMQVCESNDLEHVESDVFLDGCLAGRGYFDVRMDFTDNIHGTIKVKHKSPVEVLLNPDDNAYDPKDWREVITTAWLSLDEIENTYGKKSRNRIKDQVESSREYFNDDSILFDTRSQTFGGKDRDDDYEELDDTKHEVKAVRIISRQHKKMRMCRYFVDQQTGDTRTVPSNWSDKRIQFVIEAYNLGQYTKPETSIRWTTTADRIVLQDNWSPYRSFTIVPYFCYYTAGRPFGVVDNLVSPQEQLNKVSSQELHIVNSTANSGWVYEDGSITNHTDDEMAQNGSKTGLIITYSRSAKNPPEKITPNQIPTGIDRVAQTTSNNIKEISGVSDSLLGQENAEVSGVALQRKENRGQVQIQVPLDHLARTRKILGKKLLELVQDFYTEERVLYITKEEEIGKPREKLEINTITPEGAVINDVTVGEYDIVVTTQPARDAFQDSQFAELLEMRNADVAIPSYRIIQNSHLAHKDEIAEEVRELEGLGQQSEQEQQMAQLQMQMQMQGMQLEVQKLAEEIRKLGSETTLNYAKAEDLENSDEMEMLEADMKLQEAREGNNLRRELAQLSATSGLDKTVLSTRGQIAHEKVKAKLAPKQPPQKKSKDGK